MGKQALEHLADYIGKKIKESKEYRDLESNFKVHNFTLTENMLLDAMQKQLNPIKNLAVGKGGKRINSTTFDSILAEICKTGYPHIIAAVRKTSRDYEVIPVDDNTVKVVSTKSGQNVFNFIRNRYREPFRDYIQKKVITDLYGSFNTTRAYGNVMKQSMTDYEASKVSGTNYQLRTHELNKYLLGSPIASEKKRGKATEYKRVKGRIQLTGGQVNLGHINSVAEQRVVSVLEDISNQLEKIDTPNMGVLTSYFRDMPDIVIDILKEVKIRRSKIISGPLTQEVTVTIHSAEWNQAEGRTTEKRIVQQLKPTIIRELKKHDWANQPGSKTFVQNIQTIVVNNSIETLTKGKRGKLKRGKIQQLDTSPSSAAGTIKGRKNSRPISIIKGAGPKPIKSPNLKDSPNNLPRSSPQNWNQLLPLINAKLTPRVIANMRFPSLVNRTGTFANSAEVLSVETTKEGFPSFIFNYERNPYDVFDRTLGRSPWNTPERDPSALVDKSVREIVKEMAIGRFYTRRA